MEDKTENAQPDLLQKGEIVQIRGLDYKVMKVRIKENGRMGAALRYMPKRAKKQGGK